MSLLRIATSVSGHSVRVLQRPHCRCLDLIMELARYGNLSSLINQQKRIGKSAVPRAYCVDI